MEIREELLEGDIYRISLDGRMDIEGVASIEKCFAELAGQPHERVAVDMSAVPYMSSIGIRALLINAKAVSRRGGKYIILSPQPEVLDVLKVSGIDQLITICADLDEAGKVLAGN
ncbi:STAS domain-containing protein [Marinobacterium lutimaris]|uniref:Anti-sigma factor antagonist n=1 Tax=Marinobacterium lutimaris TaxID=568106 RepID=A0A1H5YTC2_9GAMM|nr:STAS domain-containing protein [Marinobacterium lutimaris]SEG27509.1 anti-anti-sigma factor [Marinobacterium lutimaris]